MFAVIGNKRNVEHQRNGGNPSVSRFNRSALSVSIAFNFRPDFAELLVGVNYKLTLRSQ